MENPTLSICFPTYNRGEIIEQTVNYALSYDSDEIEVIALDNCSTDDTEVKLGNVQDKRFFYYKNESNIYTANLIRVLRKARGKYALLLSDEDKIDISSLPKIIQLTKKRNEGIIVAGGNYFGKPMMRFTEGTSYGYKSLRRITPHGYMGGLFYRKDIFEKEYGVYSDLEIARMYGTEKDEYSGYAFACVAITIGYKYGVYSTATVIFDHVFEGKHDEKTYHLKNGSYIHSPEAVIKNAMRYQEVVSKIEASHTNRSAMIYYNNKFFAAKLCNMFLQSILVKLQNGDKEAVAMLAPDFTVNNAYKKMHQILKQQRIDLGLIKGQFLKWIVYPWYCLYDTWHYIRNYLGAKQKEYRLRKLLEGQ